MKSQLRSVESTEPNAEVCCDNSDRSTEDEDAPNTYVTNIIIRRINESTLVCTQIYKNSSHRLLHWTYVPCRSSESQSGLLVGVEETPISS